MSTFITFLFLVNVFNFFILFSTCSLLDGIYFPLGEKLIREQGYYGETHWVTTPDGYRLCLHRIPYRKYHQKLGTNRRIAFIQHGLLGSSADWIVFEKSLAFVLANNGYDVWMGNARGNVYSRNHTSLDPDESLNFWKFSWHEIGSIDLPTMIDYVLAMTNVDNLYYVGYSQGTTSFYVMTSTKPEYNQKIKVHVSLAPVAYLEKLSSPVVKMVTSLGYIDNMMDNTKVYELLPGSGLIYQSRKLICLQTPRLCAKFLYAIAGFHLPDENMSLIPRIMTIMPAGSSIFQISHYAQEIHSGHFRNYDFGIMGNLKKYGQQEPPNYDLSKVSAPVFLLCTTNDWFSSVPDVARLIRELGNFQAQTFIADSNFSHFDYMYNPNAPSLVYDKVVDIFNLYL